MLILASEESLESAPDSLGIWIDYTSEQSLLIKRLILNKCPALFPALERHATGFDFNKESAALFGTRSGHTCEYFYRPTIGESRIFEK